MELSLTGANIVILASSHNPTIASSEWLRTRNIMPEPPIDFVHMPVLSHYESENLVLDVEQKRWQVKVKNVSSATVQKLPVIAARYVELLPQTTYDAMGFNFDWSVGSETNETDLSQLLKKVFVNSSSGLASIAESTDVLIGGVVFWHLRDSEPMRPQAQFRFQPVGDDPLKLVVNCNYHCGVKNLRDPDERVKTILDSLPCFAQMEENSQETIRRVLGGESDE